jgi:predicted transcriptional regulator
MLQKSESSLNKLLNGASDVLIPHLWADVPGEYFCVSTMETNDGVWVEKGEWRDRFFSRREFGEVAGYIAEADARKANVYFCPHGFSERRKSAETAVLPWMLWADIDAGDITLYQPHVLIQSSRGRWQGLVWINQEWSVGVARGYTQAVKADSGCWNLTRVLRVPGTRNWKRGGERVRLFRNENRWEHKIYQGNEWGEVAELVSSLKAGDWGGDEGSLDEANELWTGYQENVPRWARRIYYEKVKAETDRSVKIWNLARGMRQAGMSLEEIYKVLHWHPRLNKFENRPGQLRKDVEKGAAQVLLVHDGGKEGKKGKIKVQLRKEARLILTSKEFMEGFIPPDYVLDGIMQQGYLYALTGKTGAGKSALMLLIAQSVSREEDVGEREVKGGKVLYLAGENPDELCMRTIGMKAGGENLFWIRGTAVSLSEDFERIRDEVVETVGELVMVVVDTSPAYFQGDEENSNAQMGDWARTLRKLTELPGKPTVVANCHPAKNAEDGALLPRGGGAFVNEVDGNLTCVREGELMTLHFYQKFRGAEFKEMRFELETYFSDLIKDSRGRKIPLVKAKALTEREAGRRESEIASQSDRVLGWMKAYPGASFTEIGKGTDIHPSSVNRIVRGLVQLGLVVKNKKTQRYEVTKKGVEELKKVRGVRE